MKDDRVALAEYAFRASGGGLADVRAVSFRSKSRGSVLGAGYHRLDRGVWVSL